MKALRAVLGRLDPWAALLLGVLVTLAIVILLATPGPWRKVIGLSPPASLDSTPPTDIAVFVRGADDGACTGIVWLHVDQQRLSLTASAIAPQTQGSVPGGGYVPLHRIVDDIGPQAAAASLSAVLKVDMDVWVILDADGLRLAVPSMFRGGGERPRTMLYRQAGHAWAGGGGLAEAWPAQYRTLRMALPELAFEDLNVVAFANYVLGFGIMQNDLDLQAATSLAVTLKSLQRSQVRVRACPAVVDVCREGEAWAPEAIALRRLRHSLAVGLTPPPSEPVVVTRRREARVLVVVPNGGWAIDAYTREVRRRLRISAGAPVAVQVVRMPPGRLTSGVKAVVAEWRPLAVLVAPPRAGAATEGMADAIEDLAAFLSRRQQPAVMSSADRRRAERVAGRGGPGRRRHHHRGDGCPGLALGRPADDARRGVGVAVSCGSRRGASQCRDAGTGLLARHAGAESGLHANGLQLRGMSRHRRRSACSEH